MKKLIRIIAVSLIICGVLAVLHGSSVQAGPGVQGDPCQNPMGAKYSVPISIPTATTTALVPQSAATNGQSGQAIDVCGVGMVVNSASTVEFEYSASNSCTSMTALTGAITALIFPYPGGFTEFAAPTGDALCVVTTGTGAVGVLTYALQ